MGGSGVPNDSFFSSCWFQGKGEVWLGTPIPGPRGVLTCHVTLGESFPICASVSLDTKSQGSWVWSLGVWVPSMGRVACRSLRWQVLLLLPRASRG